MALNRIECPDCGAGLTSKAGFTPGRTVKCPKCETPFTVSAPYEVEEEPSTPVPPPRTKKAVRAAAEVIDDDDEDEDDRPKKKSQSKKKKKKRDDDEDDEEGGSYRNSAARYAILGVLVIVMIVLAVMLYRKWTFQEQEAPAQPPAGNQPQKGPPAPPPGPPLPAGIPAPKRPNPGIQPMIPKGPGTPEATSGPQLFGLGGTPLSREETLKRIESLNKKLVGTWVGTAPNGSVHRVTYTSNNSFTHIIEGTGATTLKGPYTVSGVIGDSGLKLARPLGDKQQVTVIFEGDELIHDSAVPGESVVLRKQ